MRIRVLGPVEVGGDGDPVRGPDRLDRKAREILALLALRAPAVVTVDELTALLWDDPPPSATKIVQSHVSRLRAALAAGAPGVAGIEHAAGAYALRSADGASDVDVIGERRARARELRARGRADEAAAVLRDAREIWRGPPELPDTVGAMAVAARWDQERRLLRAEHLAAVVDGAEPGAAVPELQAATAVDPRDERLWELLVTALARVGRSSDALRAFQDARAALAEVGLPPGPALRRAEAGALAGTPQPAAAAGPDSPGPARLRPPPVRYTRVGTRNVAFVSLGEGPDLLLLNPALVSVDGLLDEARLASAVTRLAGSFRVIALDRAGIGLSDPAEGAQPAGLGDWVADAVGVLDAVGAGDVVVLANSDSALVALALAAAHPGRVRGLALVHAYARRVRSDDYPYGVDPETARATSAEVLAVEPAPGRFDPLAHVAPSVAGDPDFRRWWDAVGRRAASPNQAAALHEVVYGADVREALPAVTAPVLLLHRRSCAGCDVGHARYLADRLPHARLVLLAGADELWFTGDVAPLLDEVEAFATRRR